MSDQNLKIASLYGTGELLYAYYYYFSRNILVG